MKYVFSIIFVFTFLPFCFGGEIVSGVVEKVYDGDTVSVLVGGELATVRFQAIDAPEGSQDFGEIATRTATRLILNETVTVLVDKIDHHHRMVGRVFWRGVDVEEILLRTGCAWHYKEFNQEEKLAEAEKDARAARRGLWELNQTIPPWEWRNGKRPRKSEEFHFWAGSEEKVLHNETCRFYETCRGFYASERSPYRDCKKCGGRTLEK